MQKFGPRTASTSPVFECHPQMRRVRAVYTFCPQIILAECVSNKRQKTPSANPDGEADRQILFVENHFSKSCARTPSTSSPRRSYTNVDHESHPSCVDTVVAYLVCGGHPQIPIASRVHSCMFFLSTTPNRELCPPFLSGNCVQILRSESCLHLPSMNPIHNSCPQVSVTCLVR